MAVASSSAMTQADIAVLQNVAIFGGIRAESLEFLLARARATKHAPNQAFFAEGAPGDSMFVLIQGEAAAIKHWQGHAYRIRDLVAGDSFGEMALVDFCPRSASVIATQSCSALEISAASLHALRDHDLSQFTMIHMNIAREISRKLRIADHRMFQEKVEAVLEQGRYEFHAI